jgi:hypothetical protein
MAEAWQIVSNNLEPLRQAIGAILPPLDELERQIAGDEETEKG